MIIDVQPGDIANEQAGKRPWLEAIGTVFEGAIDEAVTAPETPVHFEHSATLMSWMRDL